MKNVAIFRDTLLPYSETFIVNQSAALIKYQPTLVGLSRLPKSLPLSLPSVILPEAAGPVLGGDRVFKLLGYVPNQWVEVLQQKEFSLLHAHFGPDALWALPIVRRLSLPFVVTFHGYDVNATQKPISKIYRYYEMRRHSLFKHSKVIIAVSNYIKTRLLFLGCPEEKIITHYIGINTSEFLPKPIARDPIILSVGRLIHQKGVHDLIAIMPQIQQQFPEVRLVVVGQGPEEKSLKALAQQLGINVEFTGTQTPAQVKDWMNKASLFCLPSKYEAFGIVYAEAQAMGLPVVAYAHGGVPEAVIDGQTGLLAPADNKDVLAQHLLTLLGNKTLRHQMGQAGQQHVKQHFDLAAQTRLLEGIYDQFAN